MAASKTSSKNTQKQTSNTTSNQNTNSKSKTTNKSTTTDKSKSTTVANGTSTTAQRSTSTTNNYSRSAAVGEVDPNVQAAYNKNNTTGYQQSQSVADAYAKLQQTLSEKPSAFSSGYADQLNSIYDKIANREKFSYDFNKDAMYQLYKDQYVNQGKAAMQDTMGQAAQLTGGYGSSYSQTAGQQAYQNYLDQLNNMIPTLRNQAYEEYQNEENQLYNQFNLANTLYGNDWQQYRANVSDWQSDRNYGQGAYESERNYDWSKYASDRDYMANQYWNMKNAVQENVGTSTTDSASTSTTNSSNTSTTNASATSKTNSSSNTNSTSNTNSNSLTNSFLESLTNSSTVSSGSGGSGGGSDSKEDILSLMKHTDLTNALAEIARTSRGATLANKQKELIYNAVKNGQISEQEANAYAKYWNV